MEMDVFDFGLSFEKLDKLFEESERQLKLLSENISDLHSELSKDLETWMI